MSRLGAMRLSAAGAVLALLLAGCAHEPAFVAELPAAFDSDGKEIAIVGDLQQTSALVRLVRRRENTSVAQRVLVDDLAAQIDALAALVIVGDLVYTARSDRHWRHLDSLVAPFAASMPVLPAIGNHDYPCFFVQLCRKSKISGGMLERFPWFEPGQPYAVASGELLLLFLDSESRLDSQGDWLADRLDGAVGRYAAVLVFFHRPAFTNSIDFGAEPNLAAQRHVVPRLESARLPVVVFNGHVHGFEYIVRNGVHYLTTAGGGGPRGAMAEQRPMDRYAGPDCPQPRNGTVFRPFNYLLLRRSATQMTIDVRGFCGGGEAVSRLDTIEIPLTRPAGSAPPEPSATR